jgi:hypothetical protein
MLLPVLTLNCESIILPAEMKTAEVAALIEMLSRCRGIRSIWVAEGNVEYSEGLEVNIKRRPLPQLTSYAAAKVRAKEIEAAQAATKDE